MSLNRGPTPSWYFLSSLQLHVWRTYQDLVPVNSDFSAFFLMQERRKSSLRTSVRRKKAFSSAGMEEVLKTHCCKKKCTKTVLNKQDILKCRTIYYTSEEEQRSFLLRFFTLSAYHHRGKMLLPFLYW